MKQHMTYCFRSIVFTKGYHPWLCGWVALEAEDFESISIFENNLFKISIDGSADADWHLAVHLCFFWSRSGNVNAIKHSSEVVHRLTEGSMGHHE
ncbi:hypothetical protein OUZ56_022194 [Daphnia magna]|uniref:Uncharacterized protein n=1 Tax=Daphnia magna TaxID=35525 RepID=A0ABR0AVP1_9CRUS|nr:hypothetical protein OUZ56_022194 [Daphnia magna]